MSLTKEEIENIAESVARKVARSNFQNCPCDKEHFRKAIKDVINLTSTVSETGEVWGMDTELGNIEKLTDHAEKILNECGGKYTIFIEYLYEKAWRNNKN